jgi:hypothetical protein
MPADRPPRPAAADTGANASGAERGLIIGLYELLEEARARHERASFQTAVEARLATGASGAATASGAAAAAGSAAATAAAAAKAAAAAASSARDSDDGGDRADLSRSANAWGVEEDESEEEAGGGEGGGGAAAGYVHASSSTASAGASLDPSDPSDAFWRERDRALSASKRLSHPERAAALARLVAQMPVWDRYPGFRANTLPYEYRRHSQEALEWLQIKKLQLIEDEKERLKRVDKERLKKEKEANDAELQRQLAKARVSQRGSASEKWKGVKKWRDGGDGRATFATPSHLTFSLSRPIVPPLSNPTFCRETPRAPGPPRRPALPRRPPPPLSQPHPPRLPRRGRERSCRR